MLLTDILLQANKPKLYSSANAFMWSEDHISEQLLSVHLNPEVDLASRKQISIQKTVDWILENQNNKGSLNILDLGCGPGLYAEIFAAHGHRVTGVDISPASVRYAQNATKEASSNIRYIESNYLDLELENDTYDLVVLIFTDLGVLLPKEREHLLNLVYKSLKKGGVFMFDLLRDIDLESKLSPKNWEAVDSGFWKPTPYLALSESYLYEQQKVILYQHLIAGSEGVDVYRFWTHFFSEEDIQLMLENAGFLPAEFKKELLPPDGIWSGDNVIFCKTLK